MIWSAYTIKHSESRFDPRTKFILLFLCVISSTIATSLQYESAIVFAVVVFGCASGKVRRSFFYAAFYAIFYMVTLFIMSLEKGILYTVFTAWLGLFYTVYPCAFLASIILSTTKVNEFLTAMNKARIPNKIVIPLAVMLRYIPSVCEDWNHIKDAMRLRDVNPSLVGFFINPTMMVECLYADELSAAAVTRGIENPKPRTCLLQIKFRKRDWIAIAFAVYVLVLGCVWRGV